MKTLPAGKYYIGDCCNVFLRGWDDFCEQFFKDGEAIVVDSTPVTAYSTLYGDGDYPSNIGATFPVDAGLIGIMPEKLWKGEGKPFGCTLVEFKESFECKDLGNGKLQFGHVIIDTEPECLSY